MTVRDSGVDPQPRRPYPNGWFAVAFSEQVKHGQLYPAVLAGRQLVVRRNLAGDPVVTDAYCPHLGANLAVGGRVEGDNVVCPFHQFAFGSSGNCVRTSYGQAPPRISLRTWPVIETGGAVFVWLHQQDAAPSWQLPPADRGEAGTRVRHCYRIVDHPQELVENAVDIGHIGPVHGYTNVRIRQPFEANGPTFSIGPAAQRHLPLFGELDVIFDVHVRGLGYISVDAEIPRLRANAEFQMLCTPINPIEVDVRFTVSLHLKRPGQWSPRARTALSGIVTKALAPLFWRDLRRDFPIWESKIYLPQPGLARGDGPIGAFRHWANQFYAPEPSKESDSA